MILIGGASLADELTGNLDTVSCAIVRNTLNELSRRGGRAMIVVTHDLNFAAEFDRQIRIVDGHAVKSGEPAG